MNFKLKLTMLGLVLAVGSQMTAACMTLNQAIYGFPVTTTVDGKQVTQISTEYGKCGLNNARSIAEVDDIISCLSPEDRNNKYFIEGEKAKARIKKALDKTNKDLNDLDEKIALAEKDKNEALVTSLKKDRAELIKAAEVKAGVQIKAQSRFGWKSALAGVGVTAALGYLAYNKLETVKALAIASKKTAMNFYNYVTKYVSINLSKKNK